MHTPSQFNHTKYTKWYMSIIERATNAGRVKLKRSHPDYIYYEEHHIIPKSIDAELKNSKSNLVLLTPKEHFLVHLLLTKCCISEYHSRKMLHAMKMLRMVNKNHMHMRKITAGQYNLIRNASRKANTGMKRVAHNKGVPMSEMQKQKLRGQKRSEKTRALMSEAAKKNKKVWFQKGNKITTDQLARRVSKIAKKWLIVTPTGDELSIQNMNAFCRENNLKQPLLHATSKNKGTHHRGYRATALVDS